MPDVPRVNVQCDDCKQIDDHPKIHYGEDTYHHDCLPPRARRDASESHPMVAHIIRVCERGLRGPELLAHIQAVHETAVDHGHVRAIALHTQED
jgi:hypothetical protein